VSKVRPIGPGEARHSVLQRIGRIVDRGRQVAVKAGLRSRRVFLVWTEWSGPERGAGDECELSRMELLPTPRVRGLDAIALRAFGPGTLPEGSIRIDLVSVLYTEDQLSGFIVPASDRCLQPLVWNPPPVNASFFYEVVEDGRGDELPVRHKYRPASQFSRNEGRVGWSFVLERISEDNTRQGPSRFAVGGTSA
jgi:hypothetical protein